MSERGSLEIKNVGKSYEVDRSELKVLENINLKVSPGEFISIVGPSGCGKSTLLRLVVGLDDNFGGDILLDGKRISGTSLQRGIVFQDHRLLPWLTLEENIDLALENSGWSREKRRQAVADHIALVGLKGFETVYPHQLSGGMSQRAAIARGLVFKPEVLLLDEPLGALDALTRLRLQEELLRIWKTEKVTMLLVTHDVEEAIYLSDRIVVMHSGPGRVADDIRIDLPWPRDRASHEFADVRREILRSMDAYAPATAKAA
ncbi:ABC transporter ATP-binding protein [Mesorhizobium sp. DCY119]|uniref:ABC transporter ATP-binding protein n=1 Tax=Mesorhizobium sp. DCY119 TaxID=2108445 RepID=UPI000E718016|nr:ABC transporter ATP-binding protein [Mesorhizobium sp. DCY119]RJG40501.1 ABC transporter ATP-binding protein [Mesorhizobium sp. DCY119]